MSWFTRQSRALRIIMTLMIALACVVAARQLWGGLPAAVVAGGWGLVGLALLGLAGVGRQVRRRRRSAFGNDLVAELDRKFASGVQTVLSTDRGLYELPWYVLVGEPGAGKTEAIRHSGIGFAPGLNEPGQGRGGTVNMDWWLAKKAILLDTAGRLMFEATDEWRSFLQLLKKHRPHTPINGMILAIPVTSLQTDEPAVIAEKAAQISAQLDAVQQTLDVRFPVYVLVTKADRIGGFREFFHNLTDPTTQNQLLGWSNPAELDERFDAGSVEMHLAAIAASLRRRRLAILADPRAVVQHADRLAQVDALYAFPTELTRLAPRLGLYLESIFGTAATPATASLFFRGVYFTSAMSEGAALDMDLAESLGVDAAKIPANLRIFEREKSYFLRDFFLDKCFPEGGLVTGAANVARSLQRRRAAVLIGLGLAALVLLATSLAAYRAMQQSVGEHAAFWADVAERQRFAQAHSSPDWARPLAWFQMFDPASGAYRGHEALGAPYPPLATIADLHRAAAALALRDVRVPWVFEPFDWARPTSLNADRRDAHRLLIEQGIYRPLMTAGMARIARPVSSSGDGSATAAAAAELARFANGSSNASTDVSAIYRLLLNDADRASVQNDVGDGWLAQLQVLERSVGRPWPPAVSASTDLIGDASRTLARQGDELAARAGALASLAGALEAFHADEQQLLSLQFQGQARGDAVDPSPLLRIWRRQTDAMAEINSNLPGLIRRYIVADGNSRLAAGYARLLAQRQSLLAQFPPLLASMGGQGSSSPSAIVLQANQEHVERSLRLAFQPLEDLGRQWAPGASADSALAEMDRDYLDAACRSDRLDAYQAGFAELSRPATPLEGGWVGYAAAVEGDSDAGPAENLPAGGVNEQARQLVASAVMAERASRRARLADAAVKDLPRTAQAWAECVAARSAPSDTAALPSIPLAVSAPVPAAGDSPTGAAAVMADFQRFNQAWLAHEHEPAERDQADALAASRSSLAAYLVQYRQAWHAVAGDVRVLRLRWDQVAEAVDDPTLPPTVASAIAARQAAARAALVAVDDPLPAGAPGDAETAQQIWSQWRQVVPTGGDPTEARRRLLALDRQTLSLLFGSPAEGSTEAAPQTDYWKQASARFLAALIEPARAALAHGTVDAPAEPAGFPLTPWSPATSMLTVDQVNALRDQADVAEARLASGAQQALAATAEKNGDPSGAYPPPVRADFVALRDGAGDVHATAAARSALTVSPVVAPRSPIAVNLYLLPVSQQLVCESAVAAGKDRSPSELFGRWPIVRFVADESKGRRTSEAESVSDLDSATQLYHTAYPQAGESATLQLLARGTSAPGALCPLAGGPWWPLVALHDGHARPAGAGKRFWYVRLWATEVSGKRRWPLWVGLDFGSAVDPAQLWPGQP
jgi:hypothetical protein